MVDIIIPDYSLVTDRTNPFATAGISLEDRYMIQYLIDANEHEGANGVVTSTTDHPYYSKAGYVSWHRRMGTDGEGLGLDARDRVRGVNIGQHSKVARAFALRSIYLHELIYADEPCIKDGKGYRYPKSTMDGHHDHVHVSVTKGTFLIYPYLPPEVAIVRVPQPVRCLMDPKGRGYFIVNRFGATYSFSWDPANPTMPDLDSYNEHPEWWVGSNGEAAAGPTDHRELVDAEIINWDGVDQYIMFFDDGSYRTCLIP